MNDHFDRPSRPGQRGSSPSDSGPGECVAVLATSQLRAFLAEVDDTIHDHVILRGLFRAVLEAARHGDSGTLKGYTESCRQILMRFGRGDFWKPIHLSATAIEVDLQMGLWTSLERSAQIFCYEILRAHRQLSAAN